MFDKNMIIFAKPQGRVESDGHNKKYTHMAEVGA